MNTLIFGADGYESRLLTFLLRGIMMRALLIFALAAVAATSPAVAATTLSYTSSNGPGATVFTGTSGQTKFSMTGCPGAFLCTSSLDLTYGVPLTVITNAIGWPKVGTHDGSRFLAETFTYTSTFTFSGRNIDITRDFQVSQSALSNLLILQETLARGGTLNLPGIGNLTISPQAFGPAGLFPYNAGGGGILRTTFILNAVPEPSTWLMMIVGFGLVGFALRSRHQFGTQPIWGNNT